MKKLADKIYDTTPGLTQRKYIRHISRCKINLLFNLTLLKYVKDFPKKQSKILQKTQDNEEVGAKRAQKFMDKCDQIIELRKQRKNGSIVDKDLTLEIAAQDWPFLYEKNYTIYMDAVKK